MKIICSILLALISLKAHAQSSVFLEGTWRIENSNNYEHWDKLNDKSFQGFSYSLEGGKMVVAEYLNLEHQRFDQAGCHRLAHWDQPWWFAVCICF